MCCRGLHNLENPAYLSRFPFSGLPCIAPYCVPGGVRVVSSGVGFQVLAGSIGKLRSAEVEALHGGISAGKGCADVTSSRLMMLAA